LLESLSGIPFPKDQSLCTRHATQITHRRAAEVGVKISIIPGPHASEEHRKQIETFRVSLSTALEFREQFKDILKKVCEYFCVMIDFTSLSKSGK
jgi:phage gp29-like protein